MAKKVSEITLGCDVSKDELVIHCWESGETITLENHAQAIATWLKSLTGPARIAIEPTSNYHVQLVEQAYAQGLAVYLVNPRQLTHYRESVNLRHKSDPDDAWLLARFLYKEADNLRPFAPRSRAAQALWTLIKRRAVVIETQKQLQQSLQDTHIAHQAVLTEFNTLIHRIEQRIKTLIRQLGWLDDYRRCLSIPGIGPLNAAALVCVYHRAAFANADAFIAFLGLDIRRRDSGRFKGKRKLTKRGESELRRLLWCAAQPARSYQPFDQYYQAQIDKGHAKIAAKVALARKLARIAFALIHNKQSFQGIPSPC